MIGQLVKTKENIVLEVHKMCTNNIYVQLIRVRSRYVFNPFFLMRMFSATKPNTMLRMYHMFSYTKQKQIR